ncbi:hypothetical protein ADL25_41725 [Streptomyces sp. NRRL F-5122]|nr:hypothetical protein ADL25_41725 [Streptomyces sp. NRRL F-5122]
MTEWNPTSAARRPLGHPRRRAHRSPRRSHIEIDPEVARVDITVTARGTDRRTALDGLTRRNTAALATRSMSQAAPDATEAAGGPDPLALESGRRHIHARIDARFTMAPPRRWTILVTRSDEK